MKCSTHTVHTYSVIGGAGYNFYFHLKRGELRHSDSFGSRASLQEQPRSHKVMPSSSVVVVYMY